MCEFTDVDGDELLPHWIDGFWVDDEWYGGYLEWTLMGWKTAGKSGPVQHDAFELVDRKIVPFAKVKTLTHFYRQVDANRKEGHSYYPVMHYHRSELSSDQLIRMEKSKKFNERYEEVAAQSNTLGCALWVLAIVVLVILMIGT